VSATGGYDDEEPATDNDRDAVDQPDAGHFHGDSGCGDDCTAYEPAGDDLDLAADESAGNDLLANDLLADDPLADDDRTADKSAGDDLLLDDRTADKSAGDDLLPDDRATDEAAASDDPLGAGGRLHHRDMDDRVLRLLQAELLMAGQGPLVDAHPRMPRQDERHRRPDGEVRLRRRRRRILRQQPAVRPPRHRWLGQHGLRSSSSRGCEWSVWGRELRAMLRPHVRGPEAPEWQLGRLSPGAHG